MIRKIAKLIANTILFVVAFGLIGGVFSFILGLIDDSEAVDYILFAILGIICGFLSYENGGQIISPEPKREWSSRKGAAGTGLLVVVIELFTLLALSVLCARFVPDSLSLALTFLIAVSIAALVGHTIS